MPRENAHIPNRPLEEWTDAELVAQYRYVEAETEEVLGDGRDKAPLERLSAEMRRRGIDADRDDLDADAGSPGREESDPDRREAR